MKGNAPDNTHVPAQAHSGFQWVLAALTVVTLVLGFWGQWRYETLRESAHAPDFFSTLYHTCQFLIAHGAHLEGTIPWQLHAGRLCGAALLFTATFVALAKFFRDELRYFSLRLPWRRNHVLICGLGDLGLRLALDACRRGMFVVAIEKKGEAAAIEQARDCGALVLEGDACDIAMLRRVRVNRAEFVVATCRDDQTNVAIAAVVGPLVSQVPRRTQALVCRLLIKDSKLRDLLADESLFPMRTGDGATPSTYRINFQDLHVHDMAARQALRRYPLDFQPIREGDETVARLVVVGSGAMGECLLVHAIRTAHFANGVSPGRRLRVTLVDADANSKVAALKVRYRNIQNVCDLDPFEADRSIPGFVENLDQHIQKTAAKKDLVTYAVCFENVSPAASREHTADDRENMRIGIELSRIANRDPVQILTYQSTRYGFAALFTPDVKGPGLSPRLHAFGMVEDIFTLDTLLHESEDRLARVLHEEYRKQRRLAGDPDAKNPGWETLREDFKDSNRHAADHIPVKLRALGYHHEPLQPGKERIAQFTKDELKLLAQMEHLRWCAERWLAGWEHGPITIREKKVNRCLIDWNHLPAGEETKDYEQVNAISDALKEIGHGIYR